MTLISLSLDIWTIEIGKPEEERAAEWNVMGIRAGRQTVAKRDKTSVRGGCGGVANKE